MNIKLPETIWQADSLKELKKMPIGRLIFLLLPNYMLGISALIFSVTTAIVAVQKLL